MIPEKYFHFWIRGYMLDLSQQLLEMCFKNCMGEPETHEVLAPSFASITNSGWLLQAAA